MDPLSRPRNASEWLVALLEQPGDEKLDARFAAWLEEDPAHRRAWAEAVQTYELIGHAPALAGEDAPVRPAARRSGTAAPPRRRGPFRGQSVRRPGRTAGAVAAAAIAAVLVLLVLPGLPLRLAADVVTGAGEMRRIALEDGSVVHLAPESAVALDLDGSDRRVRLLRGTALFDVRRDPARPFHVVTATVETTVLGTAFEVRRDEDAATVSVREGLVETTGGTPSAAVSERLAKGERVRMTWDGVAARSTLPPGQVGAWIEGKLLVKDRPVADVVEELRRYHAGYIFVYGDTLARQPVTGAFSLTDPAAALRSIAGSQHAVLYQLSPWILVLADE